MRLLEGKQLFLLLLIECLNQNVGEYDYWLIWNNMLKVAERLIVAVSPEGPILRIYWWTLEYQMKHILNQTSAFFGWNRLTSRIILLTNHCWLADEACQSFFGPTSCSLPLCFQNNCHRLSAGDFGKHNKTK